MANNCLVTKLKGAVNNNTLPIFKALFLDFRSVTSPSTTYLSGQLTIKDSDGNTQSDNYQYTALTFGAKVYNIIEASSITDFVSRTFFDNPEVRNVPFNYSELHNVAHLFAGGKVTGIPFDNVWLVSCEFYNVDISEIKPELVQWLKLQQQLQTVVVNDEENPISLADYGETTASNISGNLTGDLLDFVTSKRNKGVITGSCHFSYIPTTTKLNNQDVEILAENDMSWTENTVTWNGTTINI